MTTPRSGCCGAEVINWMILRFNKPWELMAVTPPKPPDNVYEPQYCDSCFTLQAKKEEK